MTTVNGTLPRSPMILSIFGTIVVAKYDAPAVLEAPRRATPEGLVPMRPKGITPVPSDPNPSGICMCGCGERTTVYTYTNASLGRYPGYHARFIHGHNRVVNPGPKYKLEDRGYHTPCLIWQRTKSHRGYGTDNVNGTTVQVHRVKYEEHFGPIPDGLQIDHLCRQRDCCNPDHLEAVTPAVNTRRGNAAKLTEADVREIRILLRQGIPHTEIARAFGVTPTPIRQIATGKTWIGVGEGMDDD